MYRIAAHLLNNVDVIWVLHRAILTIYLNYEYLSWILAWLTTISTDHVRQLTIPFLLFISIDCIAII